MRGFILTMLFTFLSISFLVYFGRKKHEPIRILVYYQNGTINETTVIGDRNDIFLDDGCIEVNNSDVLCGVKRFEIQ